MSDTTNETVEAAGTPEPPKPPRIATEDRLRAELIQAKMERLQAEMKLLEQQAKEYANRRNDLVLQMDKCSKDFIEKYGVDLSKVRINDDGSVTPVQQPQMPPNMMGRPRS